MIILMLMLGMWRTVASILGLSKEADTDDEDDETEDASHLDDRVYSAEPSSDEHKTFLGVVTSLHSAYGLISREICFTADVVSGSLPQVGDTVHVDACRRNAVGGWRAKRVWIADDDGFLNEPAASLSCQLPNMPSSTSDAKASVIASEKDSQELLNYKDGISITECVDFGNMQVGEASSISIVIRYRLHCA